MASHLAEYGTVEALTREERSALTVASGLPVAPVETRPRLSLGQHRAGGGDDGARPCLIVVDVPIDAFEGVATADLWYKTQPGAPAPTPAPTPTTKPTPPSASAPASTSEAAGGGTGVGNEESKGVDVGGEAQAPTPVKQAFDGDPLGADMEWTVPAGPAEPPFAALFEPVPVLSPFQTLSSAAEAGPGGRRVVVMTVGEWRQSQHADTLPHAVVVAYNACWDGVNVVGGAQTQLRELRTAAPLLSHRLEAEVPVVLVACVPDAEARVMQCGEGLALAKRYGAMYHELGPHCRTSVRGALFSRVMKLGHGYAAPTIARFCAHRWTLRLGSTLQLF